MVFLWPFEAPLSDGKRRGIILESPRFAAASALPAGAFGERRVEFCAAVGETAKSSFPWRRQQHIPQGFSNEVNHA